MTPRASANETGLLPERERDSIFAVIAEEGGFVGACVLIALYALLVVTMLTSASGLRDRFGRLVVGASRSISARTSSSTSR